jgi:asparagine synthase (glutamine-hydrolysing)
MCGISGIVTAHPIDERVVDRMNTALAHRGPDRDGTFADRDAGVYLAHRRLSVVDLSDGGRQPMTSACGRFVVVYNGEIYNYLELRERLAALGATFSSASDTEVLLQAWSQWGPDCLQHLDGMFAFALYEKPAGRLFLGRDRIGEKPLYYLERPGVLAFASEVKAFKPLAGLGVDLDVDADEVASFMGFMWAPDVSRTLVRGVRRLGPGEYATFDLASRRLATRRYWTLTARGDASRLSFRDAVDTYERLLDASVRLRLRADVPVAVMLSGGVDSSLIAALARRHAPDVRTFTVVFRRPDSEGPFAKVVADRLGSRHYELLIDTGDALGAIKDAIPTFDDLSTVDGGVLSTIAMSRLVREHGVKVVLLGEGSDEVNAGYARFRFGRPPYSWLPSGMRNALFYYSMSNYPVFRRGFLRHVSRVHRTVQSTDGDPLQQMTAFEVQHQLPNHLLMKVDKATMAASVEARVPFLDPALVEFAFGLPDRFKRRGAWLRTAAPRDKVLLRAVAARHLPPEIVNRPKFGMLLPVGEIVTRHAAAIRTELLDQPSSPIFTFVGRTELDALLSGRHGGWRITEREWLVWKVYLLHLWWRWWDQTVQ